MVLPLKILVLCCYFGVENPRRNSEKLSEIFFDKVYPPKIYLTKMFVFNIVFIHSSSLGSMGQLNVCKGLQVTPTQPHFAYVFCYNYQIAYCIIRAHATNLKVGGPGLAKIGGQGFFPFYCSIKTTCFAKIGGVMAPLAPGGVGPDYSLQTHLPVGIV